MPLNDEDESTTAGSPASPSSSSAASTGGASGSSEGNFLQVNTTNLPTLLSKSPPPFNESDDGKSYLDDQAASGEKLAVDGLLDGDGVGAGNNLSLSFNSSDSSNTYSLPNPSTPARDSLNQNSADIDAGGAQPPSRTESSRTPFSERSLNGDTAGTALSDTTNDSNDQINFFLAPVCEPAQSEKHFPPETPTPTSDVAALPHGDSTASTFQNAAFNAFETDEAGSSDWANFDQADNSGWASAAQVVAEKRPEAEETVTKEPVAAPESLVPQAASNDNDDNDDDDWSEFAEPVPPTQPVAFVTPQLIVPPASDRGLPKPDLSAYKTPTSARSVAAPKAEPLRGEVLIDMDSFLEQIFVKTPATFRPASDDGDSSSRVPTDLPVLIDADHVWQHIQKFTSETDASDSLQFKWKLSELENSFLGALCVQRALSQPKKFKTKTIPSYIYNASSILQPTKVESSSAAAAPPVAKAADEKVTDLADEISRNLSVQSDATSDTSSTKSMPLQPNPAPTETLAAPQPPTTATTILSPNQILDLDLSYFESSSSGSSIKSVTGSRAAPPARTNIPVPPGPAKPESNSVYLNKLLQDIFHSPQTAASSSGPSSAVKPSPASNTVNHKKPDDLAVANDKNSRPSSVSLISTNYFTLQPEPARLEQRQGRQGSLARRLF